MADNVTADAGAGGATFAADDIGGVHFPRTKIVIGADGVNDGDIASGNPLPVTAAVTAVVTGTAATSLGKAEDNAHASGDTGVAILAVRRDTAAVGSGTDGDYSTVNVDSSGRVWVNASGAAVPVTDNGGSLTVDGTVTATGPLTDTELRASAVPVSLAAVPSHAVTNAGTFAVQESGSALTALQLIDDTVYAEDVAAQAADKGIAVLAVRRDADTSLVGTDNDYANLQVNANGALKVEVFSGETLPVSLTSVAVTNAGTFAVQVDGSALTALQVIDNPVLVDDAAFTPGTSSVSMAGFEADETATDSVDEGDAGAARMTLDRKQIVTPYPHAAGGLSIFRSLDLDETEEDVKTSAGQVYGMWVTNTATTTRFVKFYNATAANTTVGSTTPVITIGIPGNTSDDVSGNFGPGGMGIAFSTAICVAATTGLSDADTGAPSANDVIVNIFYA